MKILRIKLKNLNSLRGEHEVNFDAEPLAGTGLFAITGPTGAGKSTLLDAITLALYGKAARYGTVPSPEDMMSRHCGECLAEVLFQVPSGTYRAEWQLHRSRAKADGKVQAPKRFVYDSLGQPLTQNVRDTEAKIEELVGLDYPRFLRSALLAQGEFAQFLKAKPDERAGLLESLTGTSIYSELGALAHVVTVKRENDLALKQAAIQQIQLLAEDQRQKLIADLPKAETRFGITKQDLEQAANLLNKATNLADSLERERKTLAEQKALAAQLKAAESDLQRLSRHRLTLPFHGDLASLQAAENAVATMQTLLGQAAVEQSQATSNARHCLLGYRRMTGEQIEKTKTEINTCQEKIRKAAERKTAAEKWLAQHQGDKELPERLADLVSDLAALKSARRDLDREWTQIRWLAMKLEPAAAEVLAESPEKITKTEAIKILARLNEEQKQKHAVAATACKTAEAELKLAEDHLSKARLVAEFEQHRASLKQGEPCPLCGAKAHPYAEGAEPSFPFKDLEGRVEKARETCKVRQKELDDLCQLQAELKNNGQLLPSAVGDFHEVLARLAQELAGLLVLVPAPGKEDETKSILQQRAAGYRKQSAEKEAAEREHAAAEADQNRLAAALSNLEDKQSLLALESLPPEPADDAAKALPRWTSIAAADVAWSAAKTDLTSRTTTFSNRQKDKDRLGRDFSAVESRLLAGLAGSAFADIAGLKTARMEPPAALQIEKLEHDLKYRSHAIEADLRATRQSIEKCRAEAAPEGDALVQLKERHRTLQNDHDQLIRDLNTWRTQLAQDDANRQSVAAKQKELETERGRLEIWRRLRGLIGSHDGRMFRRYAQTLSLDVLVRYANRHLLRLSDRYRLRRRAGEELDLEIEDFHQAGAVRPMASLSGGESFLASLALALGLSDLAGRNVRIDSLFIDEGLSSLDSETLDLALSALETLRQDTKTVGVISHVDLLKERIATQIIVEKQSGGTSSLRIVS